MTRTKCFILLICQLDDNISCALHNRNIINLIFTSLKFVGFTLFRFKHITKQLFSRVEVQSFFHEYISQTELEEPADIREGSQELEASSRLDPKRPEYVTGPDLAAV